MTSRNATGIMPRARVRLEASLGRRASDWAHVLLFGAIGWPWLARSLRGGRKADKAALLERLGLPADALPHLGSWKADVALLRRIVDEVEAKRPQTVVELGSGATSLVTAKALALNGGGRLHSYDQHGDFVELTREWLAEHGLSAEMKAAPLGEPPSGWPGDWYQLRGIPERIDMLVIDGPPWTLHPFVRGAAECLFDRIPVGGVVLLDDASRPGERVVATRWRRRWPDFEFRLVRDGTKGTLVGRRMR